MIISTCINLKRSNTVASIRYIVGSMSSHMPSIHAITESKQNNAQQINNFPELKTTLSTTYDFRLSLAWFLENSSSLDNDKLLVIQLLKLLTTRTPFSRSVFTDVVRFHWFACMLIVSLLLCALFLEFPILVMLRVFSVMFLYSVIRLSSISKV